jgi:hypothetical protein
MADGDGGISLSAGQKAFDKSWIDFFIWRNSSILLFKQVNTEITKGKKMEFSLWVILDGMKPFF